MDSELKAAMPERVKVMRVVTYDVAEIVASMKQLGEPEGEITKEAVIELVEQWAHDDFREPVSRHDLTFQDENGHEI